MILIKPKHAVHVLSIQFWNLRRIREDKLCVITVTYSYKPGKPLKFLVRPRRIEGIPTIPSDILFGLLTSIDSREVKHVEILSTWNWRFQAPEIGDFRHLKLEISGAWNMRLIYQQLINQTVVGWVSGGMVVTKRTHWYCSNHWEIFSDLVS